MSDNTQVIDPKKTLTTIPGDNIATDDITQEGSVAKGAKVQRVKVGFGKDGEYDDLTEENPLPIDISVVSLLKLQLRMLNKIERQLALLTEEDIDESQLEHGDE